MRWLALTALLMLPLAGCLDAEAPDAADADVVREVSEKLFDVLPVEEVWVSASDGKALHHAVYRPDTDEPVPVFINFSPYWGDTAETGGDGFSRYMIDEYVPRGYAVVLAAVRGTGHSEGCFQIGGDREVHDLHEVVDFFANEPWSNGNVAAGGKSYDSTTQNGLIAKDPHPALKGIFHVSGITDMYRYNYVNGVPYQTGAVFNTYYYLQGTDEYGASIIGAGSADDEDPDSMARVLDDAACTEFPRMQASGVGSGAHGLKDDYWIERDWNRYIADSDWDGSVFFVHGLQDWNVKPDHILPWLELLPEQVRVRGWLHQDTFNNGHVYPMRTDWNETMLAWLDSELKGMDNGFWDAPAFDVEATDGLWRSGDDWPPAATKHEATDAAGDNVEDPARAVFVRAENAGVRVSGAPTLTVTATPLHADAVLTAVLYDLAPDGSRTWVGEAVLRAVYRDGLESPSPVTPGTQETFTLTAYPLDVVLEPGHALEAVFGAEPSKSLATAEDYAPVQYDPSGAVMHVAVGSADARPDQPVGTPCFAC